MKYQELFQIDELAPSHYRPVLKGKWEMPKSVMQYLESNGYKHLGGGIYSDVYGREGDNIVIKVCGGSKENPKDDPWVDYVEWLGKNQKNPHYPRVGKLRWYKDINGNDFYIVAIERLHHDREAWSYCEKLRALDYWVKAGAKVKDLDPYLKRWRSWNKEFLQAYIQIRRQFPDFIVDLHQGNIMFRGEGDNKVPVLSDPLSFRD